MATSRNGISQEEWINRAKKTHGNLYDYSLVDYKGSKTKVKIICRKHGIFELIASKHLCGRGCRMCTKQKGNTGINQFEKINTEIFIKKAIQKFGNKFIYSLVNYINTKTHITISCPLHGNFQQMPCLHLESRHGCPKCADLSNAKKFSDNKELFIQKANKTHKGTYDYSLVEYKNARTNVKIICKKHGVFEQLPCNHLKGKHCKRCSNELLYKGWNEYHYFEPLVKEIFKNYTLEEQFPIKKRNKTRIFLSYRFCYS